MFEQIDPWKLEKPPAEITPELLEFIRGRFKLGLGSIHGYAHWLRVCENGLRLAAMNGANARTIILFSFIHDIARETGKPPARAALPCILRSKSWRYRSRRSELDQLAEAVAGHTNGHCLDPTVQTLPMIGWIGRVGIYFDPDRSAGQARAPSRSSNGRYEMC